MNESLLFLLAYGARTAGSAVRSLYLNDYFLKEKNLFQLLFQYSVSGLNVTSYSISKSSFR